MAKKKILALVLASCLVFSVAACSSDKADETTAETTAEATEPTVRPYDKNANQEFDEEVLYEVKKEVVAYADLDATEVAETYTEGMCITCVSTDGYYLMQNNGYIVEADCLEVLE